MAGARHGHAVLDLPSRRTKGLKIERLLGLRPRERPLRLLEVGTGSGGIAHYFASHPTLRCEVNAVDVEDTRQVADGYRFHLVEDTALPFADASFDVVLSNHVIEHVGEADAQRRHLAELRRVLCAGGTGYLAVPNRWMLVEPHYKLAFLSWLPRPLRSPYLRLRGRGSHYDCEPLRVGELEALLAGAGFRHRNLCIDALREFAAADAKAGPAARLLGRAPGWALRPLVPLIPTLVYRFEHA